MSLQSWKDEYYSISDLEFSRMSDLESLQHGFTKWSGATKTACDKHNVHYKNHLIVDNDKDPDGETQLLRLDADTCTLCQKYLELQQPQCTIKDETGKTIKCPIFEYLGYTCDGFNPRGHKMTPSLYYQSKDDPQPMIDMLATILEDYKSK